MARTMTEVAEIENAASDALAARVAELSETIEKVKKSLAKSSERLENLTAERGPLVLPARSQNSAVAQKRLREIDQDLIVVNRDIADDKTALVELEAQRTKAQNDIALSEWESRRAEVRKLLVRRLNAKVGAKLQKAVDNLRAELAAAEQEDETIFRTLIAFHRTLECQEIRRLKKLRSCAFSARLQGLLAIDTRELRGSSAQNLDMGDEDQRAFETALESLDYLRLVF